MDNLKKIEAFLDMPSDDDMVYGEALTEDLDRAYVDEWWGQDHPTKEEFKVYGISFVPIKRSGDETLYHFEGPGVGFERAMEDGYFMSVQYGEDEGHSEALTEDFEENDLPAEIRIPASEYPEYDEYYDDEDGELYTKLNIYIEDNYGVTPVDFHWVITPDEIIISDITWSDGEDIEPEVEEQEFDFPEDDVMEDLNEAKLKKNDLTDENLANFRMELQEIKDNLADFGPEGLYAVPYESFKREFPIFTEKVIESFLDEMGDGGEGDWQEGELIWENDWPCLIEGAEKLLNGKGFQWEKIYTKHYKPANESLHEENEKHLYICDDCGYEVELTDDEYDGMCPNCHEHHGFYRADESLTERS